MVTLSANGAPSSEMPSSTDLHNRCKLIDNGSTAMTFRPSLATAKVNTPILAPRSTNWMSWTLSFSKENVQLGKDRQNVGGTYVLKDSNERKVQGSAVNGKYNDVVMTAKLDDLLQLPNFDFKKVILKIDVEGYESKVFNGGQAFFNTVDVQAVLMEWRWHEGAKDIQSLLDFFTSRKYYNKLKLHFRIVIQM
jgi:FkbM family methyltransferase